MINFCFREKQVSAKNVLRVIYVAGAAEISHRTTELDRHFGDFVIQSSSTSNLIADPRVLVILPQNSTSVSVFREAL